MSAAALTNPAAVDRPFGSWTLDRLVASLQEQRGITMKRSRIDAVLIAAGVRWRTQEMWFGDRVDFLEQVEPWLPMAAALVDAVLDTRSLHRATAVRRLWLAHPRWAFVFQPTYAA